MDLKTLTEINAPSGHEQAIRRFLLDELKELGFAATLTCEYRINRLTHDPDCLYGLGRYLRPAGVDSAAFFSAILG